MSEDEVLEFLLELGLVEGAMPHIPVTHWLSSSSDVIIFVHRLTNLGWSLHDTNDID